MPGPLHPPEALYLQDQGLGQLRTLGRRWAGPAPAAPVLRVLSLASSWALLPPQTLPARTAPRRLALGNTFFKPFLLLQCSSLPFHPHPSLQEEEARGLPIHQL